MELVLKLVSMYKKCKDKVTGKDKNLICARSFEGKNYDVMMYFQKKGTNIAITTAFPGRRGAYDNLCKRVYCDKTMQESD